MSESFYRNKNPQDDLPKSPYYLQCYPFLTAIIINFVNDSTFCKVHKNATGALKKHGEQAQLIKVILTGGPVHVPLIYCHQLAYIENHKIL